MLVDVNSKFTCNAFADLGRDGSRNENESLLESVVMHLRSPCLNAGRKVTADNYFSSLSLTKKLEKKNTTFVGTIRRHLKEIPLKLKSSKTQLYESALQ